jgi:hypothetical protein
MARTARFQNGNRWHAIKMGRWTLAELLKFGGALVLLVLFVWNVSMLSAIALPKIGNPAHMLRVQDEKPARVASAVPLVPSAALGRPWFLSPELYMEEDGCDFSAAVAALRPEELEINCDNVDQLVLGDFLGQGFWREVYRANWKGREVAVKIVKEHLLNRSDIVTRHVEEVAAIFPVRNAPNIVSLVGWCNSTVVVDYVPKKLDEMLYESTEVVSVRRALELALDAARGLAQLHSAAGGPFAHSDIQTRQFLVDIDGKLLLNDFNRIKYAGPRLKNGKPTEEKCTFSTAIAKGKWRSPEEYEHADLDEKLDVYSLSLVLWSLRSREKPYANLSREKVYKKIPQGIRPPVSAMSGFPIEMQQLIVRAWDADPAKRPSASELATGIEKILEKYEFDS